MVENRQVDGSFDPRAVTANIYGLTVFSLFSELDQFIHTLKDLIKKEELQLLTTDKGVFYNIYIRQVYRQLCLPGRDAKGFEKVDLLKLYDTSLLEEIKKVCIDYHNECKPSITLNQLYADVIFRLQHKQATEYLSSKNLL